MPRRNDIAKILIIGALRNRLVAFTISLLFFVALGPLVHACSYSLSTVQVTPEFRIIVRHGPTPIPRIQVEIYDEGELDRLQDGREWTPVLKLVTGRDGTAEAKNLRPGKYLVETKGPGMGDAVYAQVGGKADESKNQIGLEWPFSRRETIKTKSLSGQLISNNPWTPFQNVQVQLWTAGLEKPLAIKDTGPQGRFHFDETRPGIYVIRIQGRQDAVNPNNQVEGDLSVELDPSAPDAVASLFLRLAESSCGIEYSSCPLSNDASIATAARRFQVVYGPDVRGEHPWIDNARFKLLDDHGAAIAEGRTDSKGMAGLPSEFLGKATLVVASSGLTTIQQTLDLLPPDEGAPGLVVSLAFLGATESGDHCSEVRLEKNAP